MSTINIARRAKIACLTRHFFRWQFRWQSDLGTKSEQHCVALLIIYLCSLNLSSLIPLVDDTANHHTS